MRWFILVFAASLLWGAANGADLTGIVQDDAGKPLVGATVRIYTAGIRSGDSPFCPSCWADCRRSARTDASGAFKFEKIHDRLVFRLLIMAKGYEPTFAKKVDPQNGATQVRLKLRDLSQLPSDHVARGIVIGEDGKPVAGAMIEPQSDVNGLDSMVATDEDGEFVLVADFQMTMPVHVLVNALGYAGEMADIQGGGKGTNITLHRGAMIFGHVTDHGKPAARVGIGIVQTERSGNTFIGAQTAQTDAGGDFVFLNAPQNTEMTIYGIMESMKGRGATPAQVIHTGADGSRLTMPEMAIAPAGTIKGRLIATDKRQFPAGTRIMLGSPQTWEGQFLDVAPDGSFAASDVPFGETIEIHVPRHFKIIKAPDGFAVDSPNGHFDGVLHRSVAGIDAEVEWIEDESRVAMSPVERYCDEYREFLDTEAFTYPQRCQFGRDKENESNANMAEMKSGVYPVTASCHGEEKFRVQLATQFGAKVCADYVEAEKVRRGKQTIALMIATPHGDFLKDLNQPEMARVVGACVLDYMDILAKREAVPTKTDSVAAYNAYVDHVQTETLKYIPALRLDDYYKTVAEWRQHGLAMIDEQYAQASR